MLSSYVQTLEQSLISARDEMAELRSSVQTLTNTVQTLEVCVSSFHVVCSRRALLSGIWSAPRKGAFSLRALTRVDDLNWLFNQALIQALPHPDKFEIVHAQRASRVNARSENAP